MWNMISEERINEDGIRYNAYGVKHENICIPDVCCNYEDIRRLVDLMNTYEVSVAHAADITEDFLAGGFDWFDAVLSVTA